MILRRVVIRHFDSRSRRGGLGLFSFRCMNLRLLLFAAWLFPLALVTARAEDSYSFAQGARGFLIRDYNEKLLAFLQPHFSDRVRIPKQTDEFDAATVDNTRLLQSSIEGAKAPSGRAGPVEFQAVGLDWPDEFLRCINLIDCWEGTLNKLEGSSESEDSFPNVTFGIVGFTSHDGSLQEFLREANATTNGAIFQLARDRLPAAEAARFIGLVETYGSKNQKRNHEEFVKFAIRNVQADPDEQQPRPEIAALFAAFDSIPHFRDIQLAVARKKSWDGELPEYREQLFGGRQNHSLRVDLFCFDMTVLTNGPGEKALHKLSKTPWHDEVERMKQIHAAMKTSPDYKDDEEKRSDILERERCIIDGVGEVHDDDYDLRAFALLPEKN